MTKLRLGLSGRDYEIDEIWFHSATALNRWQKLLADGQALLPGVSSGGGFMGSPDWALAGITLLSTFENTATDAKQKRGFQLLSEAAKYLERLKGRGRFVEIGVIDCISEPDPSLWKAQGAVLSEARIPHNDRRQLKHFIEEHEVSEEELQNDYLLRETVQELLILPNEFLRVKSAGNELQIRWSQIESFSLI